MAVGKPLKVIIVGAGFGGLGAAIECAQRGMDVTIVEKYPDSNNQGGKQTLFFPWIVKEFIVPHLSAYNPVQSVQARHAILTYKLTDACVNLSRHSRLLCQCRLHH
jgi:flavin-dependent dehydrogenase